MSGALGGPDDRRLPIIRPFGDGALLVVLDGEADVRTARRARALAHRIADGAAEDARWGAPVPAAASVLVPFDPLAIDEQDVRRWVAGCIEDLPADMPPDPDAREVVITVRYGGADGPDLADCARRLGLRPADLVAAHTKADHEVLYLGFAPGFPYIAGLPEELSLPRLATPRVAIPAGSVAIAGSMTGIYPFASPGGWRILGRTDAVLFDPTAEAPALLRPGDRVRFVAR
jgi:KipI family sensor histidine kinase inhibitor